MPSQASNPVTTEGADLGRYLFYDPVLSLDSTISCASCHKQENAFSDGGKQFSAGIDGRLTLRNTPPLFNLAWFRMLFWDGRANSIEEQVFHPVRNPEEMNLDWKTAATRLSKTDFYISRFRAAFGKVTIDSVLISKAIAQFLRTVISYRSKYDRVINGKGKFTQEEDEGFSLVNDMTKGDCLHCHTTDADPLGTTGAFSNNGLDAILEPEQFADKGRGGITGKPEDMGKFKIPSLRNLAFTAPYMHDGRFATIEEVIDFYSEGLHTGLNVDSKMQFARKGGAHLNPDEKRKILAFLYTLSDSAMVKDPGFANPFISK